jgi:hypothetical protein
MAASNRGVAWKEMIEKSLSHGISSLKTLQFDGQFTVKDGKAIGLENVPNSPGVYVVYDSNNQPCYVGDAGNIKSRWNAGHLNENSQKTKNGQEYKLNKEFTEGCIVKFLKCDSIETAAAIEAHLIKEGNPRVNSKEELKSEQGTRSNIEAKKMKDASGSTLDLAQGATIEGLKQGVWIVMERLVSECLKITKDEMVDIFKGGESKLDDRIKRFFKRIWEIIKSIIQKPFDLLKGFFEFIINAFSEAIRKIYNLARNIFDLGVAAWQLYKGSKTMTKEELITKISETIITSGCLIIWDALDAILESQLSGIIGPFAPFVAATISAIGFGISSHYLCEVVPTIVEKILSIETGHQATVREHSLACQKIVEISEMNIILINGLKNYVVSSAELCRETSEHTERLRQKPSVKIESLDILSEVQAILGIK